MVLVGFATLGIHRVASGGIRAAVESIHHAIVIAVLLAIADGDGHVIDILREEAQRVVALHPVAFAIAAVVDQLEVVRQHPRIHETVEVSGRVPHAEMAVGLLLAIPAIEGIDAFLVDADLVAETTGIHHDEAADVEMQPVHPWLAVVPLVVVRIDVQKIVLSDLLVDIEIVLRIARAHRALQHVITPVFLQENQRLADHLGARERRDDDEAAKYDSMHISHVGHPGYRIEKPEMPLPGHLRHATAGISRRL